MATASPTAATTRKSSAAPGSESDRPAKVPRQAAAARGFAKGRKLASLPCEGQCRHRRAFRFIQMADTQLGMEDSFKGRVGSGWQQEVELFREAVEIVNRSKPAFAIVCGDLVDEFPSGERGRDNVNVEWREQQTKDFKEVAGFVDPTIPLLCLCGNHDIGDRPNAITIRKFVEAFGDDYFSFWCYGLKCLVVNASLWKDDEDAKQERADMDAWLDEELKEVEGGSTPVLVFSHIPPFVFDSHEKSEYFNLQRETRLRILEKLASHGAIGWFCGHYHRNAGGTYTHASGKSMEVVVTAAVGVQIVDKSGGEPLGKTGIGGGNLGPDISGLRFVEVSADGRLSHVWKTFAELRKEKEEQDQADAKAAEAVPARQLGGAGVGTAVVA